MDLCSKIDANSECRNEKEVCDNLHDGMEPNESWKAEQSNANGSKGKEYDKGE
jgi:hypothetical protein